MPSRDSSSGKSSLSLALYLFLNRQLLLLHSWISPLLTKSRAQGTLHLSDLYELPSDMDAALLTDRLEANWFDELKRSPNNASLIRATARAIGWKLLLLGLLLIPIVGGKRTIFLHTLDGSMCLRD